MKYARYDNILTPDKLGDFLVRAVDVKSVSQAQFCNACEERNQGFSAQQVDSVLKLIYAQLKSFLELETDVNLDLGSFRLGVRGVIDPAGTGKVVRGALHTRPARELEAIAAGLPLVEVPPAQTGPALFSIEDVTTGQVNRGLNRQGMAVLYGHKIRIENGSVKLRNTATGDVVTVLGNLAENSAGKVIFLVPGPGLLAEGTYRISVETCYNGSGRPLNTPRSAELDIDLVIPCPLPPQSALAEQPALAADQDLDAKGSKS
jgi:hypothetical protein